ncbi:MAG TPA: hypothetical protein VIL10_09755 [Marmoricola sp.]|jgi:hypothetical protein
MSRGVIQGMLVGAIVLDVAFWSVWFTKREWLASEHSRAYYEFENAFPLADLWLGLACLFALVTMRRRSPSALFWLLCAGSAGMYLFCMDFLYDVDNGIFGRGSAGVIEGLIVLVTLAFSVTVLRWSWSHRGELLSGTGAS